MSRGRTKNKRDSQPKREEKRLIYAFFEGESEKQYLRLLKEKYSDSAVIKLSPKAELFEGAVCRFDKFPSFHDNAEVTDEIWFWFDARDIDGTAKDWNSILPHINTLRRLRRKPEIRVRLLMTTGCLEYWLMLHFQKYRPAVLTKEQRDQIVRDLDAVCRSRWNIQYEKGNSDIICRIYDAGVENAVKHGADYLREMEKDGLPPLTCPLEPNKKELDKRYEWLLSQTETFTTVQEAVAFLKSLLPGTVT